MVEKHNVNIANELKKLAEKRSENNQETACLFNLVIYLPDPKRLDYIREIYRVIAHRFPCRIFLIISDPGYSKDFHEISVSQEIVEKEQGYGGHELIEIKLALNCLDRASFLVIPYLFPDVPIYLLWAQDPTTERTILPRLEPLAERLIFDSECAANLQNSAHHILKNYQHFPIEMIDLNWAMISRWRDVLFTVFDSKEKVEQLKHSKHISIGYIYSPDDCFRHSNIPSIYLQGWLASCLGWRFISKEGDRLTYYAGTHKVVIELNGLTRETDLIPGAIVEIEVNTEDGHTYHFNRVEEQEKVVIQVSSLDRCEIPTSLQMHTLNSGRTFLRDVFFHPIGEHYYNMLKIIENVPWHT